MVCSDRLALAGDYMTCGILVSLHLRVIFLVQLLDVVSPAVVLAYALSLVNAKAFSIISQDAIQSTMSNFGCLSLYHRRDCDRSPH